MQFLSINNYGNEIVYQKNFIFKIIKLSTQTYFWLFYQDGNRGIILISYRLLRSSCSPEDGARKQRTIQEFCIA
jgi:hypothetical protein